MKFSSPLLEKSRIFFIAIFILFCGFQIFPQDLPPIKLDYASYAVASDGKYIGYYGEKNRIEVKSLDDISVYVIHSLIATEDREFYEHNGVSLKGLGRAILKTITGSTQGGSTITMQLARNLFLSNERTISRKLTEIDLAKKLEEKFSKKEILLLYLNTVYFGHGTYGIWAAAEEYFSKTSDKLTIDESAALVGLLQSPNGYDPNKNPQKMLNRRNEVLYNLVEVGKLSKNDFNKLKKKDLNLNLHQKIAGHFLEQIRKDAIGILNPMGKTLSADQIKISTT
ncbi:MAG: biosynthetic peptidoglycan transglycosylase [Ignavibacteriaceae bacterium]